MKTNQKEPNVVFVVPIQLVWLEENVSCEYKLSIIRVGS